MNTTTSHTTPSTTTPSTTTPSTTTPTSSTPTSSTATDTAPEPTRVSPTADRGVLGDVMGFRPSATLGRELFALAINVLIVVALAIAVQPPLVVCIVGGAIVAVILAARLAAGFATEGYAEQLKGAR